MLKTLGHGRCSADLAVRDPAAASGACISSHLLEVPRVGAPSKSGHCRLGGRRWAAGVGLRAPAAIPPGTRSLLESEDESQTRVLAAGQGAGTCATPGPITGSWWSNGTLPGPVKPARRTGVRIWDRASRLQVHGGANRHTRAQRSSNVSCTNLGPRHAWIAAKWLRFVGGAAPCPA